MSDETNFQGGIESPTFHPSKNPSPAYAQGHANGWEAGWLAGIGAQQLPNPPEVKGPQNASALGKVDDRGVFHPGAYPSFHESLEALVAEADSIPSFGGFPLKNPRLPSFEELDVDGFRMEVHKVFQDMEELLTSKRRSYGPGNLTEFGEPGIVVRMGDKWARLKNHGQAMLAGESSGLHADGETVDDAYRDMIGYAVLALIWRRIQRIKREQGHGKA